MPAPRVDAEALERGLERAVIPPRELGDVLIDQATARRLLRCDEAAIATLLAAGLPGFGAGEEGLRRCDVLNVGLYSGSGRTIPEIAEAHRVRFAAEPRENWLTPRAWDISFDLRCPRGCAEGCWFLRRPSPERAGGAVVDWPATQARSGSSLRVAAQVIVAGAEGVVQPEGARMLFMELVDDLVHQRIRYQYLPPGLRRDPEAAVECRVLDCMAASLLLQRRCQDLGLAARTRKGLLLGAATVEHVWLELLGIDGGWVPMDPVLAALASRSGEGEGFVEFACGSIANRLLRWELGADQELLGHLCAGAGEPHRADDLLTTLSARSSRISAGRRSGQGNR
jgi:hypothetical protein